ncbi:hypothetical protein [Micromonospora sp. NPDC050200]|uniref:hypothetical protein n=1 Tax=Micromonospora sp. NPDC050200 TaxID=3155664 RepID=UPI0033C851EC
MALWASLTVLLLAGLGLPAQASAAEPQSDGGLGIQLLEAPVNRRADPRAQRSIVDHLPPGTTIHRKVLVKNESSKRLHIELYPGAATVDKEAFQIGDGRAANELTSWISLDRTELDLPPNGEARVKVTIQVPWNASAGERYAVVWASVASAPRPSANVNQIHRIGVRIYLDIGSGGEPASDFTIGELVPARSKHGQPSVAIKVNNTGGRALDMSGSVNLSEGPGGTRAGPFEVVKSTTLAPGSSGTVNVLFPRELANGPWRIEVNLESGMVKRSAVTNIKFPNPGEVGEASRPLAQLRTLWAMAGGLLVIGLVMVTGLAFLARRSRRRAAGRPQAPATQ